MSPATQETLGPAAVKTMQVYLVPGRRRGYRLFSKKLHELAREERQRAAETSAEADPNPGFLPRVKAAYRWATGSRAARERLLRELQHVEALEIYFPASLGMDRARAIYPEVVEVQVRKHRRWLMVNGALLPVGVVLGLVPGPNVWLAYLAWRTLAHYRTKRGGEKALSQLPVTFIPKDELDPLVGLMGKRFVRHRKDRIREIGEKLGIEAFESFYE